MVQEAQKQRIYISTHDEPMVAVERRVGVFNVGLYCRRCSEFIAFAISEPGQAAIDAEFIAKHPILVHCPFCGSEEHRHVEELMHFRLTDQAKRRYS